MITYQIEEWRTYRSDCDDLWRAHYNEIAGDKSMPMGPDEALYRDLEARGKLQIVVARTAGVMVGYMIFVVQPHPHYCEVLCGFEDAYFLHSDHRRGWAGVKLVSQSLRYLKLRGVEKWFIHTKKNKDMGRILSRLGGAHTDEIYSGRLS